MGRVQLKRKRPAEPGIPDNRVEYYHTAKLLLPGAARHSVPGETAVTAFERPGRHNVRAP
jgi:hypothetical protein